jgi:hypothetical protein
MLTATNVCHQATLPRVFHLACLFSKLSEEVQRADWRFGDMVSWQAHVPRRAGSEALERQEQHCLWQKSGLALFSVFLLEKAFGCVRSE